MIAMIPVYNFGLYYSVVSAIGIFGTFFAVGWLVGALLKRIRK